MGFRSVDRRADKSDHSSSVPSIQELTQDSDRSRGGGSLTPQGRESRFGLDMYMDGLEVKVQRLVRSHGADQVRDWADEGMTVDTMGKPRDMRAFRERQQGRSAEVPKDIERRNAKSVQRSRGAHHEASKAGDTKVPDLVRDVISSPGQTLETSIQRTMEERMGDNLGDVRIHTGPLAAKACEEINARAFTVGNHIAFNHGEYDLSSAEGQHVLAHELAHVRQQTGGAVSLLPQEGKLEIDPDKRLEREAEETAQRVMKGGKLGVYRMHNSKVHVQRFPNDEDVRETTDGVGAHGIQVPEYENLDLEQLFESFEGNRKKAVEQIRQNDDLWTSLLRTIAMDVIQSSIEANGTNVIEDALDRYHCNIVQHGHDPVRFMTGEEANEWHLELNPNDERPHKPDCIALEFKPASEDRLYKVTKEGRKLGSFLAREETITSEDDREAILDVLGLKEMWSDYDMVSQLSITGEETVSVLSSVVGTMTDDSPGVIEREGEPIERPGGEEQLWLSDFFPMEQFEMVGPLDDFQGGK
ncbi:eCIS core domain-containing protein [Halogeometricum borinquense]|nr:DUF4157 domain-containing protein [Halogeometricum borinquense]